jgi:hypothetical protein
MQGEVQRGGNWNVTWPRGDSDGSAGQVLQFTTWRDFSEPQWTHDDLVFPTVSISNFGGHFTNRERLTVALPARRAVLDCMANQICTDSWKKMPCISVSEVTETYYMIETEKFYKIRKKKCEGFWKRFLNLQIPSRKATKTGRIYGPL